MTTIVIMAMIALFIGLRLYSVLGQRTGHEQQPVAPRAADAPLAGPRPQAAAETPVEAPAERDTVFAPAAAEPLRQIMAADPSFDVGRFLEGAQAAYRMILEAFWRDDEATLEPLVDRGVLDDFRAVIAERTTAGHRLDNRLVAIEEARIERASLSGRTATITVRFDADIAAVTRAADGTVVAGSLSDAVQTHDLWTFGRNLDANDPNWLLIETDEA